MPRSVTPIPVRPTPGVEGQIEATEEAAPKDDEEVDYTNVAQRIVHVVLAFHLNLV